MTRIEDAYRRIFKTIQLKIVFTIELIELSGGLAFATTSSRGTNLIFESGEIFPEENRELFVFKKETGNWKIGYQALVFHVPISSF